MSMIVKLLIAPQAWTLKINWSYCCCFKLSTFEGYLENVRKVDENLISQVFLELTMTIANSTSLYFSIFCIYVDKVSFLLTFMFFFCDIVFASFLFFQFSHTFISFPFPSRERKKKVEGGLMSFHSYFSSRKKVDMQIIPQKKITHTQIIILLLRLPFLLYLYCHQR